jgi:hypothetical protein
MLIYFRVNGAFSPIYALSRTHLMNFKTASKAYLFQRRAVMQINAQSSHPFIVAITEALANNPEGLSEYHLIRDLHDEGYFGDLGPPPASPHALFCAHFQLFHALYRLRDHLWQTQKGHLEIDTLKIRLLPYQPESRALCTPDVLRDYYLDLSNLEMTTEQDVHELIASFWTRLQRRDQRASALAELGLSDPVDDETIKKTYRHLAMEHHPDRGGDKERLQAVNRAVGVLLKPI